MRKYLILTCVLVLGAAIPAVAQARPYQDVSYHRADHRAYHRASRRDVWRGGRHREHYVPLTSFLIFSPFVRPPRTVVYETTYVTHAPRYPVAIAPQPVVAQPASDIYWDAGYGASCREYTATSWVGGTQQSVYGTACLQPDGAWRIVN